MILSNSDVFSEYDYQWGPYFARFMIVFWFLIFPLAFASAFFFFKNSIKSRGVYVVLLSSKNLKSYDYVFHNFLFVFLIWAFAFNTTFLIYSILDIYVFKLGDIYSSVWHILKDDFKPDDFKPDDFKPDDRKGAFMGVISLGWLLHIVLSFPYAYFNLYSSDSYFGEKWRAFIQRLVDTYTFKKFKKHCPHLYALLNPLFFNVPYIYQNNHKKQVIYVGV